MESVAEARRKLPPGGTVPQDYVFQGEGPDGTPKDVKMSELFAPGTDTLIVYNMMYSPDMDEPCLGCTPFLDGLEGSSEHINQRLNFVVVAKSPLPRILELAKSRGWRRLRLLSSAGNTYKADYHGEEDGHQVPMMNVFTRDGDAIRHFWSSELMWEPSEPEQEMRHNGTLEPLWNMFDLTPSGRPTDWGPQLSYS